MPRWTRSWLVPALWIAVLLVSYALYAHEAALEHFLWHLGYGGAAGLLAAAGVTAWTGQARRRPSLWVLGGYLYMAIPDVLWLAPTLVGRPPWPHQAWMDVFLGHTSLDAWAWATVGLVPVVLGALAGYAWAAHRSGQVRPEAR